MKFRFPLFLGAAVTGAPRERRSICGWKISPVHLASALFLAIPCVAAAQPSTLEHEEGVCTGVWSDYVKIVGDAFDHTKTKIPVVFLDRSGNAFDCLGMDLDKTTLGRISMFESSLPFDRQSALTDRIASWPVNICSVGRGSFGGLKYVSISLPLEPEMLELERCRRSVHGEATRVAWPFGRPGSGGSAGTE